MSVEDRVQKIVCEQLGVSAEEVKLEASFIDDLGADSLDTCLLYTSPSPRDATLSRMPSSA